MNPMIGIVTCGLSADRQFVTQSYIQAIEDSGAVPVLIPRIEDTVYFPRYYAVCDGFLFCGGDDISPRLFGEDLMTERGRTDEKTDRFHLDLIKYVLSTSLPLLCICRGMQVLNIALGGSIYQDISLRNRSSQNHMQISTFRSDVCHRVAFSQNSMLYDICGSYLETNSYHHQCIKDTGKNLKITGVSADGIVEAIEKEAHPFCVGVQWHPECMYHSSRAMRDLFYAFTEHAENAKVITVPVHFS